VSPSLISYYIDQPIEYVCELQGSDEQGNGTEKMPFRTPYQAMVAQSNPDAVIKVRKSYEEGFQDASGAAIKKAKKAYEIFLKKAQKAAEKAEKDAIEAAAKAQEDAKRLEESKSIVIEQNLSLPAAQKIKIRDAKEFRGQRIVVSGWLHRHRVQGKDFMFLVLRDGTGILQCVLSGRLVRLENAS
jgi:asparaginyl-tRNA synthetase